jgi:WD40 repeat protein
MKPDNVEAVLRRFKIPPSSNRLRGRLLDAAAERLRAPEPAAPVAPRSRWSAWTSLAASLLVSGAVFWAIFLPPPGVAVKPAQEAPSDAMGDPLPPGAIQRIGTLRFRHPGKSHHGIALTALALSPDGTRIASAAGDGTIRVWDFPTGKELLRWSAHAGEISAVDFSPDGRLLATGGGSQMLASRLLPEGDRMLRIWDAATGKEVRAMAGHERGVTCLAFSPTGKTIVSGSMDQSFRLWDLETGAELRKFSDQKAAVSSVSFTRDGSKLATTAGDGSLRVWDMSLLTELRQIPLRKGTVSFPGSSDLRAVFSPDGTLLASVDGNISQRKIRLWDVESGRERREMVPNPEHEFIYGVAFSPDGKTIASRGGAGKLHLWDVSSGQKLRDFHGFQFDVMACAVSPDGKMLAAGGDDGSILLWNLGEEQPSGTAPQAMGELHAAAFSPDGRHLAAASTDTTVRLWDTVTGKQILRLQTPGLQNWQQAVSFSPDGKLLASAGRGDLVVWDPRTGKELFRIPSPAECLAFSPNGKMLAIGGYSGLQLLDIGGDTPRLVSDSPPNILSVAFSPDGRTFAAVGLASGQKSTIFVGDASGARKLLAWDSKEKYTRGLAYSSDGKTLASTGDGGIRLWDAATGRETARLTGHDGWVECVAFSPDGVLLASGGRDRSVRLWELSSGSELRRFPGHESTVKSLAFSPGGSLLASVSADTTGLIWDVARATRPADAVFKEAEAESLWEELSQPDAGRAARAMSALASGGSKAVAFLRRALRKPPGDPAVARRLLEDLDDENSEIRASASTELERLGDEAAVRQALERKPSAEMKIRLELIQAAWRRPVLRSPSLLRIDRVVLALERIGSEDSSSLLRELAEGPPGLLRVEAAAALERLKRRAAAR